MLRIVGIIIALSVAGALTGGVASAAPSQNPHMETISVECEGLGSVQVITMEHAVTAFGPDGRVFVVKEFSFEGTFTITTFDGQSFAKNGTFDEPAHGKGFQNRLIECSFEESFTDTFLLDAEAADFLNVPSEYIGTEVTLEGVGKGIVSVLAPGR